MQIFNHPEFKHQDVHFFHDQKSGLRSIIAIHHEVAETTGGGLRFYPYENEEDALTDVLRLSRAMTFKNALAGLPMGGGKAVVIGNPDTDKTPELLEAFARCVESLKGRYVTACDVGTNEDDMEIVNGITSYVMGAKGHGGSTSPLTGFGVYRAIAASWEHCTGSESLSAVRVAIQGFGGVGSYLAPHLIEVGAEVIIADPREDARQKARELGLQIVGVDEIMFQDVDILAPCAMGGVLDEGSIKQIKAKVICGGANNQLAHPGISDELARRGVVFVPDFVASAGGIIHGEGYYRNRSKEVIHATAERIFDTTHDVLRRAKEYSKTPLEAAYELANERLGMINQS